jgi:hypothetical protein
MIEYLAGSIRRNRISPEAAFWLRALITVRPSFFIRVYPVWRSMPENVIGSQGSGSSPPGVWAEKSPTTRGSARSVFGNPHSIKTVAVIMIHRLRIFILFPLV